MTDQQRTEELAWQIIASDYDRDGAAEAVALLLPLVRDAERLDWLLRHLPGDAIRYCVGELADTADGAEFRAAIDQARSAT